MPTLEADAPALLDAPAPQYVPSAAIEWPSVTDLVRPRRRVAAKSWLRRLLLVVAVIWVVPNLLLVGIHLAAAQAVGGPRDYPGVEKFAPLTEQLWRGAAPSQLGYEQLAADGVTTIVDLRAEAPVGLEEELATLGLTLVRIPVRDGQSPTPEQLDRFRDVLTSSDGIVFVHCGAGVGRTGVFAAAGSGSSGAEAMLENLAFGTPSLEQLYTAATLEDGQSHRAPWGVSTVSRVVDAPRRILHVLGF